MSKQTWILVDYENVQNIDLDLIAGQSVHLKIFIGQNQKSVPVSLLTKALAMKEQVTVVESSGSGKNALDFQICFHAGRIIERDPGACISFVSKDKGFDVLVKHMKEEGFCVEQVSSLSDLKFSAQRPVSKVVSASERVPHVEGRLRKLTSASRPRKRKTLSSSVAAMFGKQLSSGELDSVLEGLIRSGVVSIDASDSVTYRL